MLYYLPEIIAFFFLNNILSFTLKLGNLFYVLMGGLLLYYLLKGGLQAVPAGLFLWGLCGLSLIVNTVPALYHPWQRLGIFLVISGLAGAFLRSPSLDEMRLRLFGAFHLLLALTAVLSLPGKFIGLSAFQGGYWQGLTSHSILLGFTSVSAILYLCYLYEEHKDWSARRKKILLGGMFISFLMMLGAGSRAALISGTLSIICFYSLLYLGQMGRPLKLALACGLVLVLTSAIWQPYFEVVRGKNHGKITELDMSSREACWESQKDLISRHPWFGVGFSCVSDQFNTDALKSADGQIETGSSWGTILVMLGAVGAAGMVAVLGRALLLLLQLYWNNRLLASLLSALLLMHGLYMCAEGYIFAAGNIMCFDFWLLTGVIEAAGHTNPSSSIGMERIFNKFTFEKNAY